MDHRLTPDLAAAFARIALGHVTREYPNKLDHVLTGDADVRGPRALHPIFYGSFDWHSCVHGYWLLARLYRRFPDMAPAADLRTVIDAHVTDANVAAEIAYLRRPSSAGFERTYGWAWMLMLQAELDRHETVEGRRWAQTMRPLAQAFADRFKAFLPKLTYAIRAGTHANTAFAVQLSLDYADASDPDLAALLRSRAEHWFGADRDARPFEPSGDDFLSPTLMEAAAMRRVLGEPAFGDWLDAFLPGLARGEPAVIFDIASVSDRSDGKIAHLDGLNLSRAWCWRMLSPALEDQGRAHALKAAERQLVAALGEVAGDYMGEHWLASFALLALEA